MPMSNAAKISAVTATDRGKAVKVMTVVRRFIRNTNKMITTSIEPSRTASMTLSIARWMKSA